MDIQKILSKTRQAINKYNMIKPGDYVGIGVSGGKDSLCLLIALSRLSKFTALPFKIKAYTVDLGYSNMDFSSIKKLCNELGIEYSIIKTDISNLVFNIRNEKNPCSLCAKMRKGALIDACHKDGINKLAFAHHKNDVINTLMLSLFYEGNFYCFSPNTYFKEFDLSLIRPFIYLNEADIKSYIKTLDIDIVKNECQVDGYTKRAEVNDIISNISKTVPDLRNKIFSAIEKSEIPGWNNTEVCYERQDVNR